jgi:hypothetical protein
MTSQSSTPIEEMLLRIPKHVRAALEAEFGFQVKTAYTMHLNDELAAVQATVPQAALPSLPPIIPKITPGKADKPATEISGSIPGKRKASGTPTRSQKNSTNPITYFANATIAAIAAATTAVTTTVIATTAVTTTAAAGTSSANALEVHGTTLENAVEVHDSDSDATHDTIPPLTFPKKEHGLTIILVMYINNHLKSIKSDLRIVSIKKEPGTFHTNYVNGYHFLATVLIITEAPVVVMDLLPDLTNIGNRKDIRTADIIDFLQTKGLKLARLSKNYEKIMRTDHASPIIIEYSVTRHSFESKELPTSWLQFCILF